ncbi:hypothetical protein DERF_006164 [Dermatophagoides farinae]|uniref:Senescence-associated protein n=1 Tax=Dermatophagoides farinae TaxID=6954 RepID=A0A922I9T9_DERFA|nr:hypothetical protein DERF_006164 [Dermatophagoides farinae]
MSESAVPLVLSRISIVTTWLISRWVNNPTLGEFCFAMIGRADIEGSKSDVAMNAWPPQASYPCGSIGRAFAVRIRTGNQDQASFCPFTLREVSVLTELALGHLRYLLTDVPPQSNSPPGSVLDQDRAEYVPETRKGNRSRSLNARNVVLLRPVSFQSNTGSRGVAMAFRGQTSARVQSRRFQRNQSQPDASPVSDHSPNGPSFRANPYPEKLEAVNLGDLLRILVRLSTKVNLAFGFSRTDNSAPDSARTAELFSSNIHISRQAVFMDSKLYREKTTLPRTAADVSKFDSVTALVPESTSFLSQFGNIDPIPFRKISHGIIQLKPGRCNGFHRFLRTD